MSGFQDLAWRLCSFRGGNLLPYTLNFATQTFDAAWTAPNWTVSAGTATNTPTVGPAELLANGDVESWASPTNLTSWIESLSGSSTINQESTVVQAGTYSCRLTVVAGGGAKISQAITLADGAWFRFGGQYRRNTTNNERGQMSINAAGAPSFLFTPPANAWGESAFTGRNVSANPSPWVQRWDGGTYNIYCDSLTIKALSALLAYRNFNAANVIVKAPWTIAAGYQAGVVARVNAAGTNYIYGYHDRTNAILVKVVGATVTPIISAVVAYSAAANVEIRTSGNNVELWYNNAQVGATQAVTDVEVTNTRHGLFSTDVSNTVSSFSVVVN